MRRCVYCKGRIRAGVLPWHHRCVGGGEEEDTLRDVPNTDTSWNDYGRGWLWGDRTSTASSTPEPTELREVTEEEEPPSL